MIQEIARKLELDYQTVKRLMVKFLGDVEISLSELHEALEANEREEIRRVAHRVAGTAGNLRIEEIATIANSIEDECEMVSIDRLHEYTDRLAGEIKSYAEILRSEECGDADKNKTVDDET